MNDELLHMKAVREVMTVYGDQPSRIYGSLLACFDGTPYAWGGSTPLGCDCSGSVCTALNVLYGRNIDATADTLYRRYFTRCGGEPGGIGAMFFLDAAGRAVHVAGQIGDGLYLNMSRYEPTGRGTVRTQKELTDMYGMFRAEYRSLKQGAWR